MYQVATGLIEELGELEGGGGKVGHDTGDDLCHFERVVLVIHWEERISTIDELQKGEYNVPRIWCVSPYDSIPISLDLDRLYTTFYSSSSSLITILPPCTSMAWRSSTSMVLGRPTRMYSFRTIVDGARWQTVKV